MSAKTRLADRAKRKARKLLAKLTPEQRVELVEKLKNADQTNTK